MAARRRRAKLLEGRLANQLIAGSTATTASEVLTALGAQQGQDHSGALWSIGLRLPNATADDIERAIAEHAIVRTWAPRGTLHFIPAADLAWMLAVFTGPAVLAATARRHEALELRRATFLRCEKLVVRALRGGCPMTRSAVMALLDRSGIATSNQRGYHRSLSSRQLPRGSATLLRPAAYDASEPTFVLIDEWLPGARRLDRDEALATLAKRYFASHGPATTKDFARWTGLPAADARAGFESARSLLVERRIGDAVYWAAAPGPEASRPAPRGAYLLPGFDEYMLGYTDRSAALAPEHAGKIVPGGNGVFRPTIVLGGRVVGTWSCVTTKKASSVRLDSFERLAPAARKAISGAAGHYGRFIGHAPIWPSFRVARGRKRGVRRPLLVEAPVARRPHHPMATIMD